MHNDTPSTAQGGSSDVQVRPTSSFHLDFEAQEQNQNQESSSPRASRSTRPLSITSFKQSPEAFVSAVEPPTYDILRHITSPDELEDAILALPPPPSYDVRIENLSIAVPPYRAYIPTPIPIPIPHAITDTVRRWSKKKEEEEIPTLDAGDGLIVRKVNAVVKRGEVMAIIGGSGSGKTTLLHAIAARLGNLPIAEGHVSIMPSYSGSKEAVDAAVPKGGEGHFKGMSKVVGFVRQNDYLLPHLTGTSLLFFSCHIFLCCSPQSHRVP